MIFHVLFFVRRQFAVEIERHRSCGFVAVHTNSPSTARIFCVARNRQFLAASSLVPRISPMARKAQSLVVAQLKTMRSRGVSSQRALSIRCPRLAIPRLRSGSAWAELFLECLHPVHRTFGGLHHGGLLLPHFPLAQMIQADVGHDAIKPRMKAAIEPERMDVLIDPQKRFLIDIRASSGDRNRFIASRSTLWS